MLTGLRDTDREVLKYVDDKSVLKVCSINRKMWYEVCDDNFLRRRLNMKYRGIEKYKKEKEEEKEKEKETWKRFFVRATNYIRRMEEKFKFKYSEGDFERQFYLLNYFVTDELLVQALIENNLSLVKYAVEKGADVHGWGNYCLRQASDSGYLEIVKYLVKQGNYTNTSYTLPLQCASSSGHLEVVKFILSLGATINESSLLYAAKFGHLETLQYLLQHFQCNSSLKSELLRRATNRNHTEMIQYLTEN